MIVDMSRHRKVRVQEGVYSESEHVRDTTIRINVSSVVKKHGGGVMNEMRNKEYVLLQYVM